MLHEQRHFVTVGNRQTGQRLLESPRHASRVAWREIPGRRSDDRVAGDAPVLDAQPVAERAAGGLDETNGAAGVGELRLRTEGFTRPQ